MTHIVEMVRGSPREPNFETHSCTGIQWEGMLDSARTFGWVPLGTIPDELARNLYPNYMSAFVPDYTPNEWRWCKRLSDADAKALSDALLRSSRSLIMRKLRKPETETVIIGGPNGSSSNKRNHLSVPTCIDAFLSFAAQGGFAFAWDD